MKPRKSRLFRKMQKEQPAKKLHMATLAFRIHPDAEAPDEELRDTAIELAVKDAFSTGMYEGTRTFKMWSDEESARAYKYTTALHKGAFHIIWQGEIPVKEHDNSDGLTLTERLALQRKHTN